MILWMFWKSKSKILADIAYRANKLRRFTISVIFYFAGNPYFISLEKLIEEELLTEEECNSVDFGENNEYIDYEKLYNGRFNLLKKAYKRSNPEDEGFKKFVEENGF